MHSFKLRGAYNKIVSLSAEEAARGLVAASAGNHAQGVALAAQNLAYQATILMPTTTPEIKVQAVRALGAEVLLHGDTYDDACDEALRLVDERDAVFVHAYDDVDVIAGQGTVAVEILEQHPEPIDALFVPVGGGGLLAGVLAYIKSMRPDPPSSGSSRATRRACTLRSRPVNPCRSTTSASLRTESRSAKWEPGPSGS